MASASVPAPSADRPLRVAFFTDSFVPTHDGVAQVTDSLARALRARGHEVTVFTVRTPGGRPWEVRGDGVRVRRYGALSAPRYPQYRVALLPWAPRAPGGSRFDVVHLHTPGFVGLAGWMFARRRGIPSVGTYHTNLADMLRGAGRNRASEAFFRGWGRFSAELCRSCDLATAPTEAARDALVRTGRAPLRQEPRVVPNGVDTDAFRPGVAVPDWRARLGIGPDAPLVTFLGRLTRDKGAQRFLDALERLGTTRRWAAVIGGEGPEAPSIRDRLGPGSPLAERARYLGAVPEPEKVALLAQSQLFVLPSLSDTSSVALLEAMACGVPAVVTSHAGPAEIVRRSSVGSLVDPEDPAAVAAAMGQLLDDPRLRQERADRGRAWVVAHASAKSMAAEFVEEYRRLLVPSGAEGRRGPVR